MPRLRQPLKALVTLSHVLNNSSRFKSLFHPSMVHKQHTLVTMLNIHNLQKVPTVDNPNRLYNKYVHENGSIGSLFSGVNTSSFIRFDLLDVSRSLPQSTLDVNIASPLSHMHCNFGFIQSLPRNSAQKSALFALDFSLPASWS